MLLARDGGLVAELSLSIFVRLLKKLKFARKTVRKSVICELSCDVNRFGSAAAVSLRAVNANRFGILCEDLCVLGCGGVGV